MRSKSKTRDSLIFLFRDGQKHRWLDQCVVELKANDKWVIPALRQIKDICSLYHVSISFQVNFFKLFFNPYMLDCVMIYLWCVTYDLWNSCINNGLDI